MRSVEEISGFSSEIASLGQEISDVYYQLDDISHRLREIKESLTFNPGELDSAIARLSQIDGLKKKYGDVFVCKPV